LGGTWIEASFAQELQWSQLSLADEAYARFKAPQEVALQTVFRVDSLGRSLPMRSGPFAGLATALSALALGTSLVEKRHNGRVIRRHALRAFFKMSGVTITWRVTF
jgi:hypothetical protein